MSKMRLVGKLKKTMKTAASKTKAGRRNRKNKLKMSKFTQKYVQIAFCGTLKQQKCCKF